MAKTRTKHSDETAVQVIQAFGGLSSAARALGVPVTTVFGWQEKGIPSWRWMQINAAAAVHKVKLPAAARAA